MKSIYLFVFCILLSISCVPKDLKPTYSLELVSTSLNFEANAKTSKSVTVTTDDPKWKVEYVNAEDKTWLEASANTYTSVVAVKPKSDNSALDKRMAIIRVSTENGKKHVDVTVTQLGIGAEILLSTTSQEIPKEGITELAVEVTANIDYEVIVPTWVKRVTKQVSNKALVSSILYFSVEKNEGLMVRTGEIIFKSKVSSQSKEQKLLLTQAGQSSDISVAKDKKIKPSAGRVSTYQNGEEITKSFDDNYTTFYHSNWGIPVTSTAPATLEYDMPAGTTGIDYIVYYTRQGGGNGNFGEIELWANTMTNNTFVKLGDYDFGMSGGAFTMIVTNKIVNPKTFKFVVKSGLNNNASCAEMEFYQYGETNVAQREAILKVFTSEACMTLKDNVTDQDIAQLPTPLQVIALKLKSNTYPKEFRCESYQPYSSPAKWASINVTRPFSNLDNPAGIEVKANEKFYVYVGETWENNISLLSVDNLFNSGQTFMLRQGINEFTTSKNGQLYIQYYVDDLSSTKAKPIEIHFPEQNGGYVLGYFNLDKHQTPEALDRILKLSNNPLSGGQFVVQGKYVQWNFLKSTLTNQPSDLIESLKVWDEMVLGHWEMMGIGIASGQFPTKRNNRQLSVSTADGYYMYATDYYVHFAANTIVRRTSKNTMFGYRDLMWGPAHEFGHQTDRALSWHGYSEASNNLFSNLTTWQYAQQYNTGSKTRGPGMQLLNTYNYEKGLNFMDFPFWDPTLVGDSYDANGLFLQLRLTWQLYIYYHILGKDNTFFPKFFKLLRENHQENLKPQERSMQFYQLACDATGTDLTEFFEAWGWFNPITKPISQYGIQLHELTPAMINTAKNAVTAKNYPKALPLQYIEDRQQLDAEDNGWASTLGNVGYWGTFRDNPAISTNIKYSKNGENITIMNGENAVGFEIREGGSTGKIVTFSVRYQFTTNKLNTSTNKLYAVRANGERVEIKQQ